MFSTEECIEILNHDIIELYDGIIINCNENKLEIPSRGICIPLNESQKRLLVCLKEKICTKRNIINIVWYENHQRVSDNNYHQLTFQLRALLLRNNLPKNLLITVPYYGLKLNEKQWLSITDEDNYLTTQITSGHNTIEKTSTKSNISGDTVSKNRNIIVQQKTVANSNTIQETKPKVPKGIISFLAHYLSKKASTQNIS